MMTAPTICKNAGNGKTACGQTITKWPNPTALFDYDVTCDDCETAAQPSD